MSVKIPQVLIEQLEQAIASMMIQYKIPGASIACSVQNEIIYSKGFGARDLQQNLPATSDTLFGFGSNSKSYTALAIMQLVEEGKLNVYDPVKNYVPFNLGKRNSPITIHHLLSHSSGIPSLGSGDEVLICRLDDLDEYYIPMSSWDDFYTFINGATQEVTADPGQKFAYLNEGYIILQDIVEKVSNMKYEEYVKDRILKPLKMDRSTFLKEDLEKETDVATCYFGELENGNIKGVLPKVYPFHELIYGAGGLISSVNEQINYLKMNMNEGKFDGNKIIDSKLLDEMHKIHIETELVRERVGDMGREGYGYGWIILEDFFGHKIVVHSGNTMVSGATLFFVDDLKIGIAMASNTNRASPLLIGIPIIMVTTLIGKNPLKDLPFLMIDEKLDGLTGIYETYKGVHQLSIIKKGGLLYLEVENRKITFGGLAQGSSVPLIPASDNLEEYKFYIMTGPLARMNIEFSIKSKGKVDLSLSEWVFHKVRDI
jgi:CubicO group peptidase (beta-lactamase class C family)